MRKILEVTVDDLTTHGQTLPFHKIRIEDLRVQAFNEAVVSDLVRFNAGGYIYTLKER